MSELRVCPGCGWPVRCCTCPGRPGKVWAIVAWSLIALLLADVMRRR